MGLLLKPLGQYVLFPGFLPWPLLQLRYKSLHFKDAPLFQHHVQLATLKDDITQEGTSGTSPQVRAARKKFSMATSLCE